MLRSLAEPQFGKRARRLYTDFIKGEFRQGVVKNLTHNRATLEDGSYIDFDVGVVATGSSYATWPIAKSNDALVLSARETEFSTAGQALQSAKKVLIIGGGIVGVELAGEIADHFPDKSVTLAQSSGRLVEELKPKASMIAQRQLEELGVKILYNTRSSPNDSTYQSTDIVYMCVGLRPNTAIMQENFSGVLDESGRIKVDGQFRVEGTSNMFALGDCANVEEGKLGYLADKQAVVLSKNMIALSNGKPTKDYKLNSMMPLVPVGRKQGFVQLPFGVITLGFMVNMKQKDMFIGKTFKTLAGK